MFLGDIQSGEVEGKREKLFLCRQLLTAGKVTHPSSDLACLGTGQGTAALVSTVQRWPDVTIDPQASPALALPTLQGWLRDLGAVVPSSRQEGTGKGHFLLCITQLLQEISN